MSCWEVKDYLNQIVSFETDENELILPICRSSLKEVESKLRSDISRDDMRIVAAAAGLAYYKLILRRSLKIANDNTTSFKAGDVSITEEKKEIIKQLDKAENYCEKMMQNLLPLCVDNSFAFSQIKVDM